MTFSINQEVFVINRKLDEYGKGGRIIELNQNAREEEANETGIR